MEPQVETTRPAAPHPTEDQLEDYSLGRLVEPELGLVETHLFVCHSCQETLAETDEYVALMKSGLAESVKPAAIPWSSRWADWGSRVADAIRFPRPVPAFSAALAALSLAAMLSQSYTAGTAGDVEIPLRAVRGGLEPARAQGPADTALRLNLQSNHLPANQEFQARIVDAAGRPAWSGSPRYDVRNGFVLRVEDRLSAGTYWVRLYDSQQKLLQEYGLELRRP
jgi:hypothetical protein